MTIAGLFLHTPKRANMEDPNTPLTLAATSWPGYDGNGLPVVSEQRALGISAYYRGIALLSGTMAKLPLKVYRKGTRERIVQRTVLDGPNPRQTAFQYWQTTFAHCISWGNSYSFIVRDGASIVSELWPIHPAFVRVVEVDKTSSNPKGLIFLVRTKAGQELRYTAWDVLHIPYLALDGIQGVSPLHVARQSLGAAIAADEYAGTFFTQGSQPSGVLSTDADLDKDQADFLQDRWQSMHAGMRNAHKIAVLDNGAKFQAVAIPPEDAQLLQTRQFTVSDIARWLGLPPHMLGDMEKSTSWGTGIEAQTTGLMVFNLDQWLTLTEQIVTAEVLPGGRTAGSWFSEWTREGLLRGDAQARAQFYKAMTDIGAMNRNEVRTRETLDPVDGGDAFLLPANYSLLHPDGTIQPLAQKPDAVPPGQKPKS